MYLKQVWKNKGTTGAFPVTADNMNHIEDGIKTNDDKLSGNESIGSIIVEDVTCKNIFDKNNPNTLYGYIDNNAKSFVSDNTRKTLYVKCKPNTTYTISKIVTSRFTVATSVNKPSVNETFINAINDNSASSITITTGSNDNYLAVWYWQTADTVTEQSTLESMQIEEGSIATNYTPFKRFEYDSVNSMGNIVVDDIQCKNIFDNKTVKFYNNNTPAWNNSTNDNTIRVRTSGFEVTSGETYTISGVPSGIIVNGIYPYDKNKNFIETGATLTDNTFTLTNEIKYIAILFKKSDNSAISRDEFVNNKIQIEKGTVATNYVEHKKFVNDASKILWKNPNPTAEFPYTTNITLSSDDYDELEFWCYHGLSNTMLLCGRTKKGYHGQVLYMAGYTGAIYNRDFLRVSDINFTINDCYKIGDGVAVPTGSNGNLIPAYIIGKKSTLRDDTTSVLNLSLEEGEE